MASKKKTVKSGRLKKDSAADTPSLFSFFPRRENPNEGNIFSKQIIEEIIDSVMESSQETKKKKHTASVVSEKTVNSWLRSFPWLIVNNEGTEKTLKCKSCIEKKVCSPWAGEGSHNFQRNSVERHNKSAEHKQAERELLNDKKTQQINTCDQYETEDVKEPQVVTDDDIKLFKTVFYACKEELPSDKINSLIDLRNINGAHIKYKNLSYATVNEIQSCISSVLERDLVEEIKQSETYTVMIDESTDLSIHKHLAICVRYVKNGEAVTRFLANVAVVNGKAHTIVTHLVECFTELGLDLTKMVSLATDGASTMTGKHTGVGVQMKSKYSPFSVQTHCIAHRLNLAVSDSIKKLEVLKKFRTNFNSLYYFMSGSSNRVEKLKEVQKIFGEPELTVKEPHSVRWLGLKNAVEAVFQSYSSVIATLAHFTEDKSQAAAKGLLKYFSEYKTVLLVSFMLDVHEVLAILSKELQKRDLVFSEIQPLMEGTLSKLKSLETTHGDAEKSMRDCLEIKEEDGTQHAFLEGEKLKRYSVNIASELSSLKTTYISNLRKNIESRFKKEDSEIFKDFSLLLEPSVVNTVTDEVSGAAITALGSLYSEKEVAVVYGNLEEGTAEDKKIVDKLIDEQKLEKEWPILKGMISGSYKDLTTQILCKRVIKLHGNMMPEFSKLCNIALCISVTSVECERSFSAQNRIKSKYRCSLKAENLQYLLNIQMNSADLLNYDPVKAVRLWITKKKRRKGRLCQAYKPRPKKAKKSCT